MRQNIYYWKCDCPQTLEERRRSYFKEKYDRPGLADAVGAACRDALGETPRAVEPVRADGNHYAFIITCSDGQYFFRADDGLGDDDYMLAESRIMVMAAERGVPAPRVRHTDVSMRKAPFRFQIMEYRADSCLNVFHRDGRLDVEAVSRQLGAYLRLLHTISRDGFGFVDTALLARSGEVRGLDADYASYFYRRLDDHLGYLRVNALLDGAACDEVLALFERHAPRLRLGRGALVHRDPALWNVLGTPDTITAIIDWDDAVIGDPADDLGILHCFYGDAFMDGVARGYWGGETPPDGFECRVWLHTVRNMLWKTMIRHHLGYFDKGAGFFLNTPETGGSLREHTLAKLTGAIAMLRSFAAP